MSLPAILAHLLLASETIAPPPEATVAALWQAFSHGPDAGADGARLRELFHPQARIIGSRYNETGEPVLSLRSVEEFLKAVEPASAEGFHECEVERQVHRFDRFALVYSVVESRTDPAAADPDVVGVNSLQLHLAPAGWQIVSLHYQLPPRGQAVPHQGQTGQCLDATGEPRPNRPAN